jgi:hypothetical protein
LCSPGHLSSHCLKNSQNCREEQTQPQSNAPLINHTDKRQTAWRVDPAIKKHILFKHSCSYFPKLIGAMLQRKNKYPKINSIQATLPDLSVM